MHSRLPWQSWIGAALNLAVFGGAVAWVGARERVNLGWPFSLMGAADPPALQAGSVAVLWMIVVLVSRGAGEVLTWRWMRNSRRRGYWLAAVVTVLLAALDGFAGFLESSSTSQTTGWTHLAPWLLNGALAFASNVLITPWLVKRRPGGDDLTLLPLVLYTGAIVVLGAVNGARGQLMLVVLDVPLVVFCLSGIALAIPSGRSASFND